MSLDAVVKEIKPMFDGLTVAMQQVVQRVIKAGDGISDPVVRTAALQKAVHDHSGFAAAVPTVRHIFSVLTRPPAPQRDVGGGSTISAAVPASPEVL